MAENETDYQWPSEGELVIGHVQTVKDFGAFIQLEEYKDKVGFIHISEISSGWVKRIRDHIREGQKRVCKVLRVDRGQEHIDLSLKQVNEHQRREKIQAWKNHQKSEKLLGIVGDKLGMSIDQCYEEFGYDLIDEFGSLYDAFEECTIREDALEEKGFEGDWLKIFTDVARENISPPYVSITGYIEMSSHKPDGVSHIKDAMKAFKDVNGVKVEVSYMAAPRYRVEIRSEDYKVAEEVFERQAKEAVRKIEELGGKGRYFRRV